MTAARSGWAPSRLLSWSLSRSSHQGPSRSSSARHQRADLLEDLLVVDGGGSLDSALVGDLIAASAVENGWAGIIVHGAIRDRDAIRQLPIGVKALGSNPRRSAKAGVGEVDVEVVIDGVRFAPGRHVWADADGVLVEKALDAT